MDLPRDKLNGFETQLDMLLKVQPLAMKQNGENWPLWVLNLKLTGSKIQFVPTLHNEREIDRETERWERKRKCHYFSLAFINGHSAEDMVYRYLLFKFFFFFLLVIITMFSPLLSLPLCLFL